MSEQEDVIAIERLKARYADLEDDREPARSSNTDQTRRIAKLMLQPSARRIYAAVVDAMDQAVGRVLATLDEQGLADDTLVLFFSDNGGAAYAMGGADNVPLRGGKGETFEGGIRVVSTLRWPAALPGGTRMEQIMSAMDVFPTLAAAAGIEPRNERPLDGRNMWPAIARGERVALAARTATSVAAGKVESCSCPRSLAEQSRAESTALLLRFIHACPATFPVR